MVSESCGTNPSGAAINTTLEYRHGAAVLTHPDHALDVVHICAGALFVGHTRFALESARALGKEQNIAVITIPCGLVKGSASADMPFMLWERPRDRVDGRAQP